MDEEEIVSHDGELPLEGVAQKLRRAREEQKLSLADMAGRTRIALRHIEIIERGDFAELPARTYAIGFTRTYARELGLDENQLLAELREELAQGGAHRHSYAPGFEPGDPAKVPPPGIVWASIIAVLLLAIGVYAFYSRFYAPGADPAPIVAEAEPAPAPRAAAAVPAAPAASADEVVFTALEDGVWVSFYEAGGRRLEQKLMARGERFVVPEDARDPRVWTGRPDAFAITIGGQPAPKLAEQQVTVRDVAITAKALRERPEPAATPEPASQVITG
ncbi:helix-turn-helix domain-containing protein [Altererythrobacter sp. Z27]|uniref:helix-turn-helix domain-containing protein n=1 Tax=Altererythrobacter sp. Z27 TaxID=3461147 RepID=UPI00404415B7